MISRRDPAHYGMTTIVGAADVVVGLLMVVSHLVGPRPDPFLVVAGAIIGVAGLGLFVVSFSKWRRERARVD